MADTKIDGAEGGALTDPVGTEQFWLQNAAGSTDYDMTLDALRGWTHQFEVGVGTMWERPKANSLNNTNLKMVVNQNSFASGGVGDEAYDNEVWALGWNLSDIIGTKDTAGLSAVWFNMEYKFNIGGKYHHEVHLETDDEGGTRNRFWSFNVPHDGGSGSSHLMAVDAATWADFAATTKIQWNLSSNAATFGSSSTGFTLSFAKNGGAIHQQRNAADSAYLDLPYYNASDQMVIGNKILYSPGGASASVPAVQATFGTDTIDNGSIVQSFSCGTQNNSEFYGAYYDATANWRIKVGVRNLHASGYAQFEAYAAGPAITKYTDGTNEWTIGKNASDNFFIGKGDPGASDVLTIDKTNQNVELANPPKLPSYTVAAAPSASTYAAGSMAYFTDGDAGSACVGVSDGTNWKVVALGANISAT